eukprot:9525292-Alexandrium_andersonii.AAC.1
MPFAIRKTRILHRKTSGAVGQCSPGMTLAEPRCSANVPGRPGGGVRPDPTGQPSRLFSPFHCGARARR